MNRGYQYWCEDVKEQCRRDVVLETDNVEEEEKEREQERER